jgi:hypothetical protein
MSRYVIHRVYDVSADQVPEVAKRSKRLIYDKFPEVTWLHSHVTVDDDGLARSFCIYEAPNEDEIRRHAALLGDHTIDGIYEVAGDVTPDDFPLLEQPV